MSDYFGLLQFGIFAGFGFAVLTAFVSVVVYPLIRRHLAGLPPALRSNILLAWLIAPITIGVLLTLLAFMPSLLSLFGLISDHCTIHVGGLHLCLIHPPLPVDNHILQLALITLLGITAVFITVFARKLLYAYKFQQLLMLASQPHDVHDIRVVDWDMPLAVSAGIRHRQVFISSQLIQALSKKQLQVVINHEQAHVRRRDLLRHFIAHGFSFNHTPWLRKRLLADMDLACEQACDEAAANRTGDRLCVAETIISVERLFAKQQLPFTVLSINGSNISQRVESILLEPTAYVPKPRAYIFAAAILLITSLASANGLHHQTESILGFLVR